MEASYWSDSTQKRGKMQDKLNLSKDESSACEKPLDAAISAMYKLFNDKFILCSQTNDRLDFLII
jgi:hypothetical protein